MSGTHTEKLVALFETRDEAEAASRRLAASGPQGLGLEVLEPGEVSRIEELAELDAAKVVKDVAAGAGVGAVGVASAAAMLGITVLATGPVAAALVGAGIGAGAGAAGAAAASTALREPAVAEMVREASRRGLAALLVGVSNEAQALEVQDLLERTAAVKVIDRHGGQHAS